MKTIIIKIKGMRSAACVSSVEHTLQQFAGVQAVRVDLLTGEALLRSFETLDLEALAQTMQECGFTMEKVEAVRPARSKNKADEFSKKLYTIAGAGAVLLCLDAVAHFYKYLLPLTCVQVMAVVEMFFLAFVIWHGKSYLSYGLNKLKQGEPHLLSLLAISCFGSFAYNIMQVGYVLQGYAGDYDLYGAAVAAVLFFTALGDRQKQEVERIFTSHVPQQGFNLPKGTLLLDDKEYVLPGNNFFVGDIILVKEGGVIPVDGIVLDGEAEVSECELTGSTELICKKKKAEVLAESVLQSGSLKIRATAVGKDVQAVQLWRQAKRYASEPKAMQKVTRSDDIAAVYLPVFFSFAVVAALSWYFYTNDSSLSGKVFVSVLLTAYPYAFNMAHSGAVLQVYGAAAQQGIIFKSLAVLEQANKVSLLAIPQANAPEIMDLVPVGELKVNGEELYEQESAGVKRVTALLPQDKAELVQSFRRSGEHVLTIGNRLCDMPALASGDLGVAQQSSAAEQFAQIVVPAGKMHLLPEVFAYSFLLAHKEKNNARLALFFNIVIIPVAAGVAYAFGSILLEPLFAVAVVLLGGMNLWLQQK